MTETGVRAILERPPVPPRDDARGAESGSGGAGHGHGGKRAPGRGATPPRAALLLAKILPHLLVLAIVGTVVLGDGFWDPALRPGLVRLEPGVSPDLSVPLGPPTVSSPAASPTDPRSGYFTRPALPATAFRLQITQHETGAGETIATVASRYGLRPSTLLWANGLQDPAKPLPAGTKLRIPPLDGMLHLVQGTDTLASIAAKYKVEPGVIIAYRPNNVEGSADLVPNQYLLVPGGQLPTRERVELYDVRAGDTLWTIAERFGINPSTIVWANELTNADELAIGQRLIIPPVNGILHRARPGETLEGLADRYGVSRQDIIAFAPNGLGGVTTLAPGQELMIPGGTPPAPPPPPPPVAAAPPEPPPAPAPAAPGADRHTRPRAGAGPCGRELRLADERHAHAVLR